MSLNVILTQMIIIFLLISIGAVLFKLGMLSDATSKQLSGIVVNITNPAVLICSAITDEEKEPLSNLLIALIAFTIIYGFLLVMTMVVPRLLGVKKPERYSYKMLTVFGNVGFIGIPLASALLGTQSLIYVSVCNLVFSFLLYTYAATTLEKTAKEQHGEDSSVLAKGGKPWYLKLINSGTISCVLTVILYVTDIRVPVVFADTLNYCGRCTTMLSMLVLGVVVAQMAPKQLFTHRKLYFFTLIRQVIIPILIVLCCKPFIKSEMLLAVIAIEYAVPAANTPLMFSKQLGVDETTIAHGILMTTLFSLVTIPLVFLFL